MKIPSDLANGIVISP